MAKQTWKGGKLLLALADFLENDPRVKGHFDMGVVLAVKDNTRVLEYGLLRLAKRRKPDLERCGTVACAMGWAPHVPAIKRAGLSYVKGTGWELALNGRPISFFAAAQRLFDLEDADVRRLFYQHDGHRTREQVAHNIRRFVTAECKRMGINADA